MTAMRPAQPPPRRSTEEIWRLNQRCESLEFIVSRLELDLKATQGAVEHLQETVDQMIGVLECGQVPAPVFLRWDFEKQDGPTRQEARARFGRYTLEVIDGRNAVYSEIKHGSRTVWAGGHPVSFSAALDEAEEALRRLIQEKQIKEVPAS